MKLLRISLLACLPGLLLLCRCASNEVGLSKDVNQDEICQTYFVTYNQAEDLTEVTAFFRFAGPNGTTLVLSEPSTIKMNGEEMAFNQTDASGAFYTKTIKGQLPNGDCVFEFTDTDGKSFTNKLKWQNFAVDSVQPFAKGEDLKLKFTDNPGVRDGELTVEVSDTATGIREGFRSIHLKTATIKAEKLDSLKGALTVSIKREDNFKLRQQTNAGGFIYTEYRLKPFELLRVEQ